LFEFHKLRKDVVLVCLEELLGALEKRVAINNDFLAKVL